MAEPKSLTVTFKVDPESWQKMEELKGILGTPDVATALYSATLILEQLYDYQRQGYKLAYVDKHGKPIMFDLPRAAKAA
jgi:hypothetical protein